VFFNVWALRNQLGLKEWLNCVLFAMIIGLRNKSAQNPHVILCKPRLNYTLRDG